MYSDFDFHAGRGLMVLLEESSEGNLSIAAYRFGEERPKTLIQEKYLPQCPRISPDGKSLVFFGSGRVYIHDFDIGETRCVFDRSDFHAAFACWSPDSAMLAFGAYDVPVSRDHPPSIYTLRLKDSVLVRISDTPGVDRFPHWSITSRYVAFRRDNGIAIVDRVTSRLTVLVRTGAIGRHGWFPRDDSLIVVVELTEEVGFLRLFRWPEGTEEYRSEVSGIRRVCFFPDGDSVLAVCRERLVQLSYPAFKEEADLPLATFAPIRVGYMGPCVCFGKSGRDVFFLGEDSRIYRWTVKTDCRVVVRPPLSQKVKVRHQFQEYRFTARDGLSIPVQRYVPETTNGRCILFIEGGPGGGAMDPEDPIVLRLLQGGYEVLRPAYRGSDGYGKDHRNANRGVCGDADVADIVDCGLDWQKRFNKGNVGLAVSGFSYGGYLTFLALTHPEAPWCCGITLWGCTEQPPLVYEMGMPTEEALRKKADIERSPAHQASRIGYPLLILHGARDRTAKETDVWHIAARVKASGVPCELVVFDDDGHGLHLHREEMYAHIFRFLDQHFPKSEMPNKTNAGDA